MAANEHQAGAGIERSIKGHYASPERVAAYLKAGGTLRGNLVLDLENNRFRKVA